MSVARSSPTEPGRGLATALLRVAFAAIFGVTGFLLGREAYLRLISLHVASQFWQLTLLIAAPVVGAVVGVLVVPFAQTFFERELHQVERAIDRLAPGELVGGAIGFVTGLVVAFLAKSVLFEFVAFAGPTGGYIAIALYLVLRLFAALLGARVGANQRVALTRLAAPSNAAVGGEPKVLDTSVIIDGRVLDIVRSGFLEGPLLLPRFVLRELQMIADSGDPLKRTRGRRGLELLGKLQETTPIEIVERDPEEIAQVDAKLVRLAHERGAKLVTHDYNLKRVAL